MIKTNISSHSTCHASTYKVAEHLFPFLSCIEKSRFYSQVHCSDRRNRLFYLFSDNGSHRSRLFSIGSVEFRQFPYDRIPIQFPPEKFPVDSAKFRPGICWKSTEPMGTDRNSSDEIWIGILSQGNRRNSTESISPDVPSLTWAGKAAQINLTPSDPTGIRRRLSESLVSYSDRKLSDVGKCRNLRIPIGYWTIPILSDIQQLPVGIRYQGFRRIPIGSDNFPHRIRWNSTVELLSLGGLGRKSFLNKMPIFYST